MSAQPASAANGGAVLLGHANTATLGTSLAATTTASALTVTNGGTGPAGTLTSYSGHGLVSSTRIGNRWGAYALNSSATNGGGGALLATAARRSART